MIWEFELRYDTEYPRPVDFHILNKKKTDKIYFLYFLHDHGLGEVGTLLVKIRGGRSPPSPYAVTTLVMGCDFFQSYNRFGYVT